MKRVLVLAILAGCSREPDPALARMLDQRRVDAFEGPMRAPPPDTVPRDDDRDDAPPNLDSALVEQGRAHYEVTCAPCHGANADGQSYAAARMKLRPPPALRGFSRERTYRVMTEGYGLMPSSAAQLNARERWAVIAYLESRGTP